MADNYQIGRMTEDEVNLAVQWAAREGWNPGLNDAFCFYQADPQGFFAGKLNGQTIAVGSAVVYDDHFAFCGFYIVDPIYRRMGYGLELTKARLAYVGDRNAGIDGVLDMLNKYERLGYRIAHNNARYTLKESHITLTSNDKIILLNQIPFSEIESYDRRHFPAPRSKFLEAWIGQSDHLALGYLEAGQLRGFGMIRPCLQGYKIGPLFADNPSIGEALFLALAHHGQGEPIYLDIPENNPYAVKLVEKYGMEKVFATARMYLKGAPDLPQEEIFGITSYELG